MNWNSPVADEAFDFACELSPLSRMAVPSRYSKSEPVLRLALRIAASTSAWPEGTEETTASTLMVQGFLLCPHSLATGVPTAKVRECLGIRRRGAAIRLPHRAEFARRPTPPPAKPGRSWCAPPHG